MRVARLTTLVLAVLAAAAATAGAEARDPQPGAELLVMNDGIRPVTSVRLRPAGGVEDSAWTGDLLEGEPIPVGEGRRIDLTRLGQGCEVEIEVRVEGRADAVAGQQQVCADPRFWMGFALGLDEPGMGAIKPGQYAVVVGDDEPAAEAPMPAPAPAAGPPPDLNRGLPVCPGDPRCRKKK